LTVRVTLFYRGLSQIIIGSEDYKLRAVTALLMSCPSCPCEVHVPGRRPDSGSPAESAVVVGIPEGVHEQTFS